VKLRNPFTSIDISNLINLIHLNEPEILYHLKKRYFDDIIYTYTGPILIAINPFKELRNLNGEKIIQQFTLEVKKESSKSPAEWMAANNAYNFILTRQSQSYIKNNQNNQNKIKYISHSILISGESGAGKTERLVD
jgi:myosin heavy subunit